VAVSDPFSPLSRSHSNGKSWKKQPLSLGAKKGSGVAARVTFVECFDKPRFDQAGDGFAGCH